LDIAFHDRAFLVLIFLMANLKINLDRFRLNNCQSDLLNGTIDKMNYNEYIKIFWVGLMDGYGSIQVNHWRKKSLQYRLIIKLSNFKSNYNMLIEIAKVIGGTVRITSKGSDVIW
jgi:hypothetical protein